MPYSEGAYWDDPVTVKGHNDQGSQGSVADRAGNYEKMGGPPIKIGGGGTMGYGFGKKKGKGRNKGMSY